MGCRPLMPAYARVCPLICGRGQIVKLQDRKHSAFAKASADKQASRSARTLRRDKPEKHQIPSPVGLPRKYGQVG